MEMWRISEIRFCSLYTQYGGLRREKQYHHVPNVWPSLQLLETGHGLRHGQSQPPVRQCGHRLLRHLYVTMGSAALFSFHVHPHAMLLLYTNCCVSTYWGQIRSDKCWRDLWPGFTLLFNSPHIHPCSKAELLKKLLILTKALNLPFLFWSSTVTGFEIKN